MLIGAPGPRLHRAAAATLLRPSAAPPPGVDTLLDGLVAWWDLEEASGARIDAHGAFDLTDNNTVASVAGRVGDAASFVAANSEYLSRSAAGLHTTGSFSVAGWFRYRPASTGSTSVLVAIGNMGPNDTWSVRIAPTASGVTIEAFVRSAAETNYSAKSGPLAYESGWHFFAARFDAAEAQLGLRIDAGAWVSAAAAASPLHAASWPFSVGAGGSNGAHSDVDVDSLGLWHRALTDAEVAALWNGGAGVDYAAISA